MRILTFQEFTTCPEGTIFCFLDDGYGYVRDFCRKEKTIYSSDNEAKDFFFQSLLPQMPFDSDDLEFREGLERWGEYDLSVRYAVYDETDLALLRTLIQ